MEKVGGKSASLEKSAGAKTLRELASDRELELRAGKVAMVAGGGRARWVGPQRIRSRN